MVDKLQDSKAIAYFQETAFNRNTITTQPRPEYQSAETFKKYPGTKKITLPRTSWKLDEARIIPLLQQRRSLRKFAREPVELLDVAFMLWACQGITAQAGRHFLRVTPSAGALYPIETYLIIQNVNSLEKGIYHFDVLSFQLELIKNGDFSKQLASAFLEQNFLEGAAVNFIWTSISRRTMAKYGERGLRYILLDAGHLCQNLIIAAEAINCGACPVAAFYDNEVNDLLEIDGTEELAVYSLSVGRKPK